MNGTSHIPAGLLTERLAGLQQDSAPQAATPTLTADATDAELLAAVAREPRLLARLSSEAQKAFLTARQASGCDWRDLDTIWYRFATDLQRAGVLPPDAPDNGVVHQAMRAAALRLALRVRQTFLDKAVPEMSAADRLANQPVPTAVHAHRLSTRSGPHPMEPTLALLASLEAIDVAPVAKVRRGTA
ncbi:MAG: hypothetical protein ACRYG8_08575 [Janthinobacterium lividum]